MEHSIRVKKIPVIKLNEFSIVENYNTIDCFIGFNNESEKDKYIELIKDKMSAYNNFKIYHDFHIGVSFDGKKWYYEGDVMIYENKEVNEDTRLVVNGKGDSEFCLWMSAIMPMTTEEMHISKM